MQRKRPPVELQLHYCEGCLHSQPRGEAFVRIVWRPFQGFVVVESTSRKEVVDRRLKWTRISWRPLATCRMEALLDRVFDSSVCFCSLKPPDHREAKCAHLDEVVRNLRYNFVLMFYGNNLPKPSRQDMPI